MSFDSPCTTTGNSAILSTLILNFRNCLNPDPDDVITHHSIFAKDFYIHTRKTSPSATMQGLPVAPIKLASLASHPRCLKCAMQNGLNWPQYIQWMCRSWCHPNFFQHRSFVCMEKWHWISCKGKTEWSANIQMKPWIFADHILQFNNLFCCTIQVVNDFYFHFFHACGNPV